MEISIHILFLNKNYWASALRSHTFLKLPLSTKITLLELSDTKISRSRSDTQALNVGSHLIATVLPCITCQQYISALLKTNRIFSKKCC